jgi:hypothetical protein
MTGRRVVEVVGILAASLGSPWVKGSPFRATLARTDEKEMMLVRIDSVISWAVEHVLPRFRDGAIYI